MSPTAEAKKTAWNFPGRVGMTKFVQLRVRSSVKWPLARILREIPRLRQCHRQTIAVTWETSGWKIPTLECATLWSPIICTHGPMRGSIVNTEEVTEKMVIWPLLDPLMSRNISTVSLLLDFSFLQSYRYFNLAWFTIVEHYTSTWIGINDLNRESSFKWSDGTPFAFMNWADTEPNGNEGENCGEMKMDDWTKGRWNDYICSEPLHFVCEKKGSNYVEPPKPPKPEPQCAEGWQRVADRCIYNSFNFGRTASNWTEAKAVCKGFHEGSTLVSIRNQEDQDSLYCKLSR